jgi:poly-beta-1,6-N-acetyl-D-glucosamine synthase
MNINQIIGIYLLFALFRAVYALCVGFFYVHKTPHIGKDYNPLVSVVIPAWNESVGIAKTVKSVLNNSYKNLEIIVVNDGSSDNTSEIVEKLIEKNPEKIRLISQENGGKHSALNNGIKNAKGEIIVTIDGDSYVYQNAIKLLIQGLSDNTINATVGKIIVGKPAINGARGKLNIIGIIQFFEYIFGYHMKKTQHHNNSIYILPGAFAAIRKSAIEAAGYYEGYSKTEDFDISMKLRMNGSKIAYVDDALCATEGASNLKGLIDQRTRWRHGFLVCLLHRKNYLTDRKKGLYLTYIDFPLVLLGILDILLYPVFFVFIIAQVFTANDPTLLIIFYAIIPFAYIMMFDKEIWQYKRFIKYLPFIPLMFTILNIVEFVALVKSIYRIVTKKDTAWTKWVRLGIQ